MPSDTRSLILHAAEVQELLRTGRCEAVRAMKPQPASGIASFWDLGGGVFKPAWSGSPELFSREANACVPSPFGSHGEVRWVRETWAKALWSSCCRPLDRYEPGSKYKGALYAATPHPDYGQAKYSSATTMPRWASRLTVRTEAVRAEQRGGVWVWIATLVREVKP